MGNLEERVYSNFFKGAILRANSKEACFYYYGLQAKSKERCSIEELDLENFPYLQSFLEKQNQFIEMSYDGKKQVYSAVLCCFVAKKGDKKSNVYTNRRLLYAKDGVDFYTIFDALEECLREEKYKIPEKRIQKRLLDGACFQVSGTFKMNGIFMYDREDVWRRILETEFLPEEYLLHQSCFSLVEAIHSGKILEFSFEEGKFILELFSLVREGHQGPFTKRIEARVVEKRLSNCLEEMENLLEEKMVLARKKLK